MVGGGANEGNLKFGAASSKLLYSGYTHTHIARALFPAPHKN